jgi:diguanylate cyclase (GGDEF)-like protein
MSDEQQPAVGRVIKLAVATGLGSLALTAFGLAHLAPILHIRGVGVFSIALAFALAEALPVHLEHRREAVSITLSSVPFVIGLYALSPVALVVARLSGSAATLLLYRRQPSVKLVTNLVSFWVHIWASVIVFRALTGETFEWSAWPALLFAVVVGDLVQTVVLAIAISLYQRRWEASLLGSAAMSTVAAIIETSLGLIALSLCIAEPAALVPLAVVVTLVLASYRTHRSLGDRHRELSQLYDFATVMGGALPEGRVVSTVLEQAQDLMHADRAWLHVHAAGDPVMAQVGARPATVAQDRQADVLARIAARATATPRLVDDSDDDLGGSLAALGARQILVVSLHGGAGPIGTLMVADRSGDVRGFGADDLRLFSIVAHQAGAALENDRLIVRLQEKAAESEHQSLHDALTGLPNRLLFARELDSTLSGGASSAVLLLDLDRFKEVNDTLGHQNGDLLLQQVGVRLRDTLRRGDVIARLGGDEFAILLPDIEGEQAAIQVARGIVELLEQPLVIGDMSVDVGASIGIAISPRDGTDPGTLLQRADVAMYTAKADQTGVETYSQARDSYSPERLTLVSDLRHAINEGQLEVHYQPQVDLLDGRVTGVEALVRWSHPTRGVVYPDDFIAVAEHAGLIRPLTLFVLDAALSRAMAWRRDGIDLRVSVNLSARSLAQPTCVEDVARLLERHDTPAGALCLEITESSVMAEPPRAIAALEALRALGVTIAVDDFGTGHSSLAYLKQLPVDELKIDKSFVMSMASDATDAAIVDTVLSLARNLGVDVIAEGVEDEVSADRLQAMGCPTAQGYLFARPMPGESMLTWLRAQQDRAAAMADRAVASR